MFSKSLIEQIAAPFNDPVLRSREFLRLAANGAANGVSVGADYVLVGWLALQAAENPTWVGGGFALYHLPGLLLGVPAGSLADRVDRHRLLRLLEIVALVVLVIFAAILATGRSGIVVVYALTIALGSLRAVHQPTRLAYTYDIAGAQRIIPAISALKFSSHLGNVAGAAIGGVVTARFGAHYALLSMAIAHALAWACLWDNVTRATSGHDPAPIVDNLRDYAREMTRNRLLMVLVLVTAGIEMFGTSFYTALPELAQGRLEVGADGFGWLVAISQTGGLAAAFALFVLPRHGDTKPLWVLSIVGLGVAVIALGVAPSFLTCAIALGCVAAAISSWDVLTQSMMQLSVPDRLRGRAMGAWMFAIGSAPVGHLQMGFVVAWLGLDMALYLNGAMVLVVISIALLCVRGLRPG